MEALFLPIFPEGALSHSVTTCVWVGVFIIALFNLRLGWVLSGLVVPGYLAPLLFVKPWSAGVVIFEAIITYLIVYWFSERGSRLGVWSALFGRDRFFALVLVSVAVRLVFDTWLLPDLAAWLDARYALTVDFRNNLHSFGLIIICLLANQFWKTGLLRGIVPVLVPIVLTFLVIRFGLMEFTNFSVGNLNYIYEDVAASLLASPKSYMVLLLAAFIASRMNLYYGWDYNGILIPALLALQWYQPERILVSFVEAAVILLAARLVLRLPWLGHVNIEGGRKLLLFFNISFAYKLLLGWAVIWLELPVKATDYYGFGYLLPTLIAIKMHDKEIVARLSRATLQTSLTAVLAASVLAFFFSRAGWDGPVLRSAVDSVPSSVSQIWKPLSHELKDEPLRFYEHRAIAQLNKPLAREVDHFSHALTLIDQYRSTGAGALLSEAAALLMPLNFEVLEHRDWILIRERSPTLGWGTYVLAKEPGRDLHLQLPAPLENGHLIQISARLFELYGASTLAIAGNHIRLNQNSDPLSTLDQATLFQAFHRFANRGDILQVRGLTEENRRALGNVAGSPALSELRVDSELPEHLDLALLNRLTGAYATYFQAPATTNIQRRSAAAGFAELYLADDAVRQLLYATLTEQSGGDGAGTDLYDERFLAEWLTDQRPAMAGRQSNLYEPLTEPETLFFDEQILSAMLQWTTANGTRPRGQQALQSLASINNAASVVGHGVRLLQVNTDDPLLVLAPLPEPPIRYSAFVVLRLGNATAQLIQAPRPQLEPGSLAFAQSVFNETRARALIVSGVHAATNVDGSANVLRLDNKSSLFNLASQVLTREAGANPLALVQIRGFGPDEQRPNLDADVLLSSRPTPVGEPPADNPPLRQYLTDRSLRVTPVDGRLATLGYENHFVLQNRYLDQSVQKSFWTLWVAKDTRLAYRHQAGNRQLLAQLSSLDIPVQEDSLTDRLAAAPATRPIDPELAADLRRYQVRSDVMLLADLLDRYGHSRFKALIDRRTQQLYLLVGTADEQIAGVFLLGTGIPAGRQIQLANLAQAAEEFLLRRESWLTFEASS